MFSADLYQTKELDMQRYRWGVEYDFTDDKQTKPHMNAIDFIYGEKVKEAVSKALNALMQQIRYPASDTFNDVTVILSKHNIQFFHKEKAIDRERFLKIFNLVAKHGVIPRDKENFFHISFVEIRINLSNLERMQLEYSSTCFDEAIKKINDYRMEEDFPEDFQKERLEKKVAKKAVIFEKSIKESIGQPYSNKYDLLNKVKYMKDQLEMEMEYFPTRGLEDVLYDVLSTKKILEKITNKKIQHAPLYM